MRMMTMSKIIILGDTHFGARNSNQIVQFWQEKFYNEVFWPYVDKHNIEDIIQTGDYFDNRKWINLQTMAFQQRTFVEQVQKRNINAHVLVGNHDIPLRHSLENSSVEQILGTQPNFTVYKEPTTVEFDDRSITFMPWVCRENEVECTDVIKNGGDILVGHFEITGFTMHPGAVSKEGITPSDFASWKTVWSGHYHSQSENSNIRYVGTPYQMTWNDCSTKHGFWVFDTFDESMVFIENPYSYFHRIIWNEGTNFDCEKVYNSYVKINVEAKSDYESFEKFIDRINYNNPYEVKINESFEEFSSENVSDIIELQTTQELIEEYISDVATVHNKDNIVKTMLEIYNEALELE